MQISTNKPIFSKIRTQWQYWPGSDETFAPVSAPPQAAVSALSSCVQPEDKILEHKISFTLTSPRFSRACSCRKQQSWWQMKRKY